MFMPSLAFMGKSAPMDLTQSAGSVAQAPRPLMSTALMARFKEFAVKLPRAALALMVSSEEPIPPRHLQGMMKLLRMAGEIERTQPDVAAELRWLAMSTCYY